MTFVDQPGTGSYAAEITPGGSFMSTLTVAWSSRSLGTRTSSRANPPSGAAAGWTVTWAPAAAGGARAMSRAAVAAIGVRMGSFT